MMASLISKWGTPSIRIARLGFAIVVPGAPRGVGATNVRTLFFSSIATDVAAMLVVVKMPRLLM